MVFQQYSREQQTVQTCSDSKWWHILTRVLVIIGLDALHLALPGVMLRLLEAFHKSPENKVLPVNSNSDVSE